jgi:hypothetical protein
MRFASKCGLAIAAIPLCCLGAMALGWENDSEDLARLQSLKESILSGGSQKAIDEIRSLPNHERQKWLSSLHQTLGHGGSNGGGAIADYSQLIQLIESTIDADWVSAGGSAQLMPYRNGVRIDPHGVIERFDPSKSPTTTVLLPTANPKANSMALEKLGEWQEPTELRWVSLHQLDLQIAERLARDSRTRANLAMEVLGGLYRIDYVAFDRDTQEWLLGGPAGNLVLNPSGALLNSETQLPPVLLEDLLCIAPQVLSQQGEFGCTIDPDPKRLADSHHMSRTPASMRALQRNPERWVEQWRQKLGRQHTKVFGLSQNSPTGYALIVADAHMKRLGLEIERCPTFQKSYWQEREILAGSATESGMVRWWFSLANSKIPMDPKRKIYRFVSSNVQVQSEAQMMNTAGQRVAAMAPDLAADAFAKDFSLNFAKLQREYPCYGRLRHIFDLAVALEIVRVEIHRGNGKAFSTLQDMNLQPVLETAPLEIESVASTHKLPDGTVTAIVSGGVSIEVKTIGHRMNVDLSQTNQVSLESSNDVSKSIEKQVVPTRAPWVDKPFWR